MPQPSQKKSQDLKARDISRRMILDRTARLLVEKGYSSTSLRDIAGAAGMKAGSLYYHFDSKESLVEEILTEGVVLVQSRVQEALDASPDADPMERIKTAMNQHLQALHDRSDYASAHIRCFAHVPPEIRQRLRGTRGTYEAVWDDLLEQARQAGGLAPDVDLRTLKFGLIGMMNWTLEWRSKKQMGPKELADHFYRIAIEGAATR